jgi:hypothetical protein
MFSHEKITSVKKLIVIVLTALLWIVMGCSRNDYVGAGESKGGDTSASSAATAQDYAHRPPEQIDSASNGGFSTKATDPYSHGNGATISQNVNPTPFMGSSAGGLRGENPQNASTNLATNRAVGEMEGATDQPPGAIAPGDMGPVRQPMGLSAQPFAGIGEGAATQQKQATAPKGPSKKSQ